MAESNYGPYDVQSFKAAIDLVGKVGFYGVITSTGVNLAGNGIQADGVIVGVERAGAGNDIGLMTTIGRKVPVVVNEAVSVGDELSSDAGGKANTSVSTDVINGIALEASGADNDLVTTLFGYKGVKA